MGTAGGGAMSLVLPDVLLNSSQWNAKFPQITFLRSLIKVHSTLNFMKMLLLMLEKVNTHLCVHLKTLQ